MPSTRLRSTIPCHPQRRARHRALPQSPGLCGCDAGHDGRGPRRGRKARGRGPLPDQSFRPTRRAASVTEDGSVTVPKGFKEAYDLYREGGWLGLAAPEEFGGQGLPYTLHTAVGEFMSAANMSLMMYPGLTQGRSRRSWCTVPKTRSGPICQNGRRHWTGTMNLTEPHCGTDSACCAPRPCRTATAPTGSPARRSSSPPASTTWRKMSSIWCWRASRARPDGVKGISLFIVPKFKLDAGGEPGERNGVSCGAIEHKMGIHGNATCVMNYDEATGYLIGTENRASAPCS